MGEKVLWKYVLCCLNNENCYLNNTTKHPFEDEDLYDLHSRMIMEFGHPNW